MAKSTDTNGEAAGLAALAICESLLLALTELKVIDDHEKRGVLEDAAATHHGAAAISTDITGVLMNTRGDVLTFGVAFALYFASSGVESLRIGLNRAYDMVEKRPWWLLRIESIGYVIIGAIALLAFAFLVVLAPLSGTS